MMELALLFWGSVAAWEIWKIKKDELEIREKKEKAHHRAVVTELESRIESLAVEKKGFPNRFRNYRIS